MDGPYKTEVRDRQREFDAATDHFTASLKVAAGWRDNYFGAAYSTRIDQAIKAARLACDEMEVALRHDRTQEPPMSDFDINKLPGLKQGELQKCIGCGKGMMHAGAITFYRLKMERFVIDARAVHAARGLEMMLGGGTGGAMLAQVMGPNPDLAKAIVEHTVLICEECSCDRGPCIAEMAERASEREHEEDVRKEAMKPGTPEQEAQAAAEVENLP